MLIAWINSMKRVLSKLRRAVASHCTDGIMAGDFATHLQTHALATVQMHSKPIILECACLSMATCTQCTQCMGHAGPAMHMCRALLWTRQRPDLQGLTALPEMPADKAAALLADTCAYTV
jgi:hypothetical protein